FHQVKQQKLLEAPGSWGGCAGCVRGGQRPGVLAAVQADGAARDAKPRPGKAGAGWASKMEALEMGAAWPRQEGGCWAMA
ncbi:hypothetical protein Taro_018119, partial [Colocasia esculenta]|nr:hypothetical protein [Colocasia esculenta]